MKNLKKYLGDWKKEVYVRQSLSSNNEEKSAWAKVEKKITELQELIK